MTERPILFSADMVQAILAGRKTQTRRVIQNAAGPFWDHPGYRPEFGPVLDKFYRPVVCFRDIQTNTVAKHAPHPACPYGYISHNLWVRETWRTEELDSGLDGVRFRADNVFIPIENNHDASMQWLVARNNDGSGRWRPSIFMPRWASRLTLEITGIRIERLQSISLEDAEAEGVQVFDASRQNGDVLNFAVLWETINAKRGYPWASNPWVWVIEFTKSPLPFRGGESDAQHRRGEV